MAKSFFLIFIYIISLVEIGEVTNEMINKKKRRRTDFPFIFSFTSVRLTCLTSYEYDHVMAAIAGSDMSAHSLKRK